MNGKGCHKLQGPRPGPAKASGPRLIPKGSADLGRLPVLSSRNTEPNYTAVGTASWLGAGLGAIIASTGVMPTAEIEALAM